MSPFLFSVGIDVVSELAKGVLSELLYADDLVMASKTIDGLRNMSIKWKTFESKSSKVNLG